MKKKIISTSESAAILPQEAVTPQKKSEFILGDGFDNNDEVMLKLNKPISRQSY